MKKDSNVVEPQLSTLLEQPPAQRIPALPLQFDHIPVELLSKEFTRLNNPHPYRIHYLGPRFMHTLALHRRYAFNEELRGEEKDSVTYPAPLRRIFNSNFMNERLRDNHHYRSSFFYRAFEGMNPTIPTDQLSFNSAFENGNLDCAIKVAPAEFDLFLRIDSNSRGHTNWYHFSVSNKGIVNTAVRFHICNLKKKPGLYDQGFRPFVRSTKGYELKGQDWEQKGEAVEWQAAPLRYDMLKGKGGNFFRLSFSYTFEFADDEIFFAYCAPYTYSDLHKDIHLWQNSSYVKKTVLGRSLSGLQLPLLHVTNHKTKGFNGYPKKNVVVTGRVHPGESNGSYVLKGFIQWLLSDQKDAFEMRERANLFIVPMLNPDGVVMGNSRTSAAGKDLNRQFIAVKKDLYPEVYHVKTLLARLQKRHKVTVFLDFHGHSRRKNTFFYGPAYPITHRDYYRSRAFPKLIEKINPSFRFYGCSFQISEEKRAAARAVALSQLRVPYAYTVESSVGLYYDPQAMKTFNFTIQTWQQMGSSIALGLTQFITGIEELQSVARQRRQQREKGKDGIEKRQKRKYILLDIIEEVKVAVSKGTFDDDVESDDHDSDEDLEQYQLSEFNNLVIAGKQRQRKEERKPIQEEEEEGLFQVPLLEEQEQVEEINPYQEVPKPMVVRSTRSVQPKGSWSKILQASQRKVPSKVPQDEKKPMTSTALRSSSSSKNFIHANRQRFSSSNLNFEGSDRCEIISLPKTPLIKRDKAASREKIGKPMSELSHRKGIHSIVDKIDANIGRMHQNFVDTSLYQSLRGLQLDNRALTITTFRKR